MAETLVHQSFPANAASHDPHRRGERKAARAAGEAFVVEGQESLAATARGVMQGVGKIEAAAQVAKRAFDRAAVFHLNVPERKQMLEYVAHGGGRMAVNAAQHPFQFERDGFGDEQAVTPRSITRRAASSCVRVAAVSASRT